VAGGRAGDRRRLLVACLATLLVLAPPGRWWQAGLLPAQYSAVELGYLDYGGGPRPAAGSGAAAGMHGMDGSHHGTGSVSVAALRLRSRAPADVRVDLTARKQTFRLASGRRVDGYTVNGTSPGPQIDVTEGQLLEVRLHNADVGDGITLHWHGIYVPNAEDGVAGVTQDAVAAGQSHTYRFYVPHEGTYWYHSHQVSHEQVVGGLFGALVVHPRHPVAGVRDVVAVAHTYAGRRTLNGREGDVAVPVAAGGHVRVRVVNTDNGPVEVWAGGAYRLVAGDGYDVHGAGLVSGKAVTVTAGGRADLELVVPAGGVRVQVGSATALVLGPAGSDVPPAAQPTEELDRLTYGTPERTGLETTHADRSFEYSIGRRPGFVDGRPGVWWSVNGHLFPDMPMFVVSEGDVVRIHYENHSGDVHPMHLHGHHAVVLARNGVRATGGPWWFDSLNVRDGESYDVAFRADNPGVWMDHCHNLQHAAEGLVTHLMYAGVSEPYRVGGGHANQPE
jgi:FtsP/CotA-like multicopper oxidase with cupredoxin domain